MLITLLSLAAATAVPVEVGRFDPAHFPNAKTVERRIPHGRPGGGGLHAIGDAANAQIISVYEQMHRKYPGDRRWRIEHFQIVDPADIPRIAPAGIIASMQPTHQTSDRLMAEKRLGSNRLAGAYAWRTVLKTGAKLAFGTDFPVESANPFPGLSAAISRQDMPSIRGPSMTSIGRANC